MKAIKKFFSGLLVLILVSVILGGVGFVGYNIFKSGGMKMGTTAGSNSTSTSTDSTKNTTTTDSMSNMPKDTSSTQSATTNNAQSQQNSASTNQINAIMQSKDLLDKTSLLLDDSLKLMTLDPFAVEPKTQTTPDTTQNNNAITKGQDNTTINPTVNDTNKTTQGNTTVNVYPSTTAPSTNSTVDTIMKNMGVAYDQTKMEQVHAGLYKLSIGTQLLNQLKDNLSNQIEQAGVNVNNVSQYYNNQYYITMDNKNKLNSALTYLNESADLININPYIATSGAVYDKNRMLQIHQSIMKRAEAIVGLNKLSDNFSKQLISLSNLAQNSSNTSQMDMPSTNKLSGILTNINIGTIASIVLVIFVVIFIIGLLGFIKSLFKPTNITSNK